MPVGIAGQNTTSREFVSLSRLVAGSTRGARAIRPASQARVRRVRGLRQGIHRRPQVPTISITIFRYLRNLNVLDYVHCPY